MKLEGFREQKVGKGKNNPGKKKSFGATRGNYSEPIRII